MKYFCTIIILIVLFSLLSCNDTTEPVVDNGKDSTLTQDYFIYYPMSQNQGWRPEHAGLFRSNFLSNEPVERLITSSIIHTSKVSKDGKIAFLTDVHSSDIWIRYKDGNTQMVPFPVQTDNGWQIGLDKTPGVELSTNGNLLVYFVTSHKIDGTAPDKASQSLVTIDLTTMTLTLHNLRQFYIESFSEKGFDNAQLYGKNILINEDGSKIWFVLKGMDFDNGTFSDLGYSIIQFENGQFKKYGKYSSTPIELSGIDFKSNKIFCNVDNLLKYTISGGDFINSTFSIDEIYSFHQFELNKSIVVIGDSTGISLYDTKTESLIKTVITWDSLGKAYPLMTYKATEKISISPDGGLIVFALHPKNDIQSYTLYAIRKDGSGLKRIVPETPLGMPVVSYGFKN
jgi:hypothetical protein